MKKLIAISVVFALVAGAAFAVDVTGTVFGKGTLIQGDTGKDDAGNSNKATAGGQMKRVRLDGAGEAGDGEFGGYIRYQSDGDFGGDTKAPGVDSVYAWWKPMDQFKLIIGKNSDAFWGKEGVTGWGFNQVPYDCGIAQNPGVWYGWGMKDDGITADGSTPYIGGAYMHNRYTFYEGWSISGTGVEITPTDMIGINLAIPFSSGLSNDDITNPDKKPANQAAYVYKAAQAQLDIKMDFGNIAISYDGGYRNSRIIGSAGAIYVYYGGSFGDLGLDVGFSYHLTGDAELGQSEKGFPIGVGLGVKYVTDSFGVKFRTTVALAGDKEGPASDFKYINASVLPFFNVSDNMAAFVNVGIGMVMAHDKALAGEDSVMGWYFNPYLRVGAEWGPSFYFGVNAHSDGVKKGDAKVTEWEVPIALVVSF